MRNDPKIGFQSVEKLERKLKDKGITRNQIKVFINYQEVHPVHNYILQSF